MIRTSKTLILAGRALVGISLACGNVRAANLIASAENAVYLAFEPFGIMEYGRTYAWSPSNEPPTALATGISWKSMAAGRSHTLYVDSLSALYSWGNGDSGQLGIGNGAGGAKFPIRVGLANDWKSVSAGGDLTSAIKTDGSLWTWGAGIPGETVSTQAQVPVRVGASFDWKSVATGYLHRLAIRDDGSLWAWGYNSHGSLGDKTFISKSAPVRVGTANDWVSVSCGVYTSFAIKQDGSIWAWGRVFGSGSEFTSDTPAPLGKSKDWRAVYPSTSRNIAFAIKQDGSLWSWGENPSGVLGLGDTSARPFPVRVGTTLGWSSVAPGDRHVVATKNDGSIWMWGFLENTNLPQSPVPVDQSSVFNPGPRMRVTANNNGAETYTSGVGTLAIHPSILDEPIPTRVSIANRGLQPLLISAINLPSGFTLDPASLTVPPLGFVNYQIRLSATSKGLFSGTAHILSNIPSLPNFSLNLSGWVVSPLDDTDGDGLNDAAEIAMAQLGFLFNYPQPALVDTLMSKSKFAGLISEREVFQVDLRAESPTIDVAAQTARLRFQFRDSVNHSPVLHSMENLPGPTHQGIKLNFEIPENHGFVRLRSGFKQ